jgi:hypothetical protein
MFLCVPFNQEWVNNDRSDLAAIYRRPRHHATTGEVIRDEAGNVLWDLTAPLPVRRHNDFLKKGFEYITLADVNSLQQAAGWIRSQGLDPQAFLVGHGGRRSPWNAEAYLATQTAGAADALAELKTLVKEFGLEAVTKIKRQTDPSWQVPAALVGKGIKG